MASVAQLEAALVKADAAGNTEDARAFAAEIRRMRSTPAAVAPAQSEIPQRRMPPISVAGDRGTNFGQQVKETGMTADERQAAVAGIIPVIASLAAGPVLGGAVRAAAPFVGARLAPAITRFGQSISSGGLAPNLSIPQRVLGAGTAGAASTAVVDPENIGTGTAIAVATPAAVKVVRTLARGTAPTTKQLKDLSQTEYNSPEVLAASVNVPAFQTLRGELDQIAINAQYLPTQHPKITKALTIMDEQQALGQPVALERLDELRREFSRAANSASFKEREMGKAMVGKIDDFIRNNTSTAAAERIEKARELFTYMSRSKVIDDIISKADLAKSGDRASVIQDEFRKISNASSRSYAAKKRQFTDAEQALIADIAEGRLDIDALRGTANLLMPTTLNRNLMLNLPGYGFLASQFGPAVGASTAAAAFGTGVTSRALANRLAIMRADQLRAQVATGGAVRPRFSPQTFPQVFPAFAPAADSNMLAEPAGEFRNQLAR